MAIEMQTAFTTEIDDAEDALADLFAQINLEQLKENSLAVVTCYYDFLETGVYAALAKRLPFDVLGCTAMASAAEDDLGQYRLNLSILSSDDVSFTTVLTEPLVDADFAHSITAGYEQARAKLEVDPVMLLAFFPLSFTLSASDMLTALDSACAGVPIFGSLPTGFNMNYDGCHVFLNGEAHPEKMALALLVGNHEPRFFVTHIPSRNIREARFTVTESRDCVLYKVNDVPVREYLDSLGLQMSMTSRTTLPFMLYSLDAQTPVAASVYGENEDGSLLFGVPVPVGMTMAIGEVDPEGILSTGMDCLEQLLAADDKVGALLMPCISRYIMLAPNQDSEMIAVSETLHGKLPYALHYAGGEICPIKDNKGMWRNHFHNFSFAACVF
ncbi:MAG: FIST C-terminal domain-containing protein [Coriobacteriales bacterium]|nr:FIST C-terminal domain-containing protein [Coriobacteriales bacterium]